MPAGQQVALEPALAEVLDRTSMTRPSGARWSSPGSRSAIQARSVTSRTAPSRFELFSSGLKTRKVVHVLAP